MSDSNLDVGAYIQASYEENEPRTVLRGSDAGRCKRELWASLHGKIDLPQSFKTQLTRFDLGTEFGKLAAQRFVTGFAKTHPARFTGARIRSRVHGDNRTYRHLIRGADEFSPHVIEIKTNYSLRAVRAPAVISKTAVRLLCVGGRSPGVHHLHRGPSRDQGRTLGAIRHVSNGRIRSSRESGIRTPRSSTTGRYARGRSERTLEMSVLPFGVVR